MGGIQLEFRLIVLAVAPGALVIELVMGGLGTQMQGVQGRELLAKGHLRPVVPVLLAVGGGPGEGAGRTALGAVVEEFRMDFTALQRAPEVYAALQLFEVIVPAGCSVCQREGAIGKDAAGMGGKAPARGRRESQFPVGLPGPPGTGREFHGPSNALPVKDRLCRMEGQAVLGIVHYQEREILQVHHPQVCLAALDIANPNAIQVDGRMGAAQPAQAGRFQAGRTAVVPDVNARSQQQGTANVL